MEYRHELKFLVSEADLCQIQHRISCFMARDIHQAGEAYTIRSLYFDDLYDTCLGENYAGVDHRTKYRIRLYNGQTTPLHLEKKEKYRGMTRKVSQSIFPDDCLCMMAGLPPAAEGPLARELECRMLTRGLIPKCIVEYDRSAYVEELGNVRITFDRNIRGAGNVNRFLDPVCGETTRVLPPGQHILEVKFDELLPQYLLQAIDLNHLRRTSFSKYAMVRGCIHSEERYL